ncbi:uncharacterized protein KNAG_0J01370 [Huiozyma naganishii CBS 8797]|uniref:Uncharacterized protein n=1 Tax=Huiozyma naganishii (strain ATCC MYA-139 / BCRC 22969 / CBS 8797 / KCTC 17520 / NBRC 10181 / NCYC 3082 / Yp74L-3) TaxID=1071383 RepID=J7RQW6_HUIN7|nr:hypothetical protein KNAG_0J01370 [Kazachstania naganishii CBS 8797]CCK72218.1 hypothetical protein KNAG_0J01370 [Kazachstania naganishii CBS 8797]
MDTSADNKNVAHTSGTNPPIHLSELWKGAIDVQTTEVSGSPSTESMGNLDKDKRSIAATKMGTRRTVAYIDILKYIMGTLPGKDKLAKIIKALLDLIKLYLSSPHRIANLKSVSLLLKPVVSLQLLVDKFLTTVLTHSRANFASRQLGNFRYVIRCGGTPFRVIKLAQKLGGVNLGNYKKKLLNETTLQDVIDLYYGIFDELDTLHRLKIWKNEKLFKIVSDHECISWESDIMLGLKKNWAQLQTNWEAQQQLTPSAELSSGLREALKREERLIKLDIARLTCDLLANSSELFHWNIHLPKGTYEVLSLASGCLGFAKCWIVSREELITEKKHR